MKQFLDLTANYNFRLVHSSGRGETLLSGFDGACVGENQVCFDKISEGGGGSFILRRNLSGDCVECLGQVVDAGHVPCKSVYLLETSAWGSFHEIVAFRFSDGTEERRRIFFCDHFYHVKNFVSGALNMDAETYEESGECFACFSSRGREISWYVQKIEFESVRNLNEIVLPDNLFLKVFAVTVED